MDSASQIEQWHTSTRNPRRTSPALSNPSASEGGTSGAKGSAHRRTSSDRSTSIHRSPGLPQHRAVDDAVDAPAVAVGMRLGMRVVVRVATDQDALASAAHLALEHQIAAAETAASPPPIPILAQPKARMNTLATGREV